MNDGPRAVQDDDLLHRLRRSRVLARLFEAESAPQRFGRYVVLGTLGAGGMGTVLRAYDEALGREVALKVLNDDCTGRHEQRLLREAQALARLSHPNVVQVFDVGTIDDRLCMAMELVPGVSLDQWQREPHAWPEILRIYLQAARGLAAAHVQGLVHRDFKPANCILAHDGRVKVLDFGLARGIETSASQSSGVFEQTSSGLDGDPAGLLHAARSQTILERAITRTGTMLGTLAYMAPEQLRGRPADATSDQFSFCAAVYEALYGVRPFEGLTTMAIYISIREQVYRAPASASPSVPGWLRDLLHRGLSLHPERRFPSMDALISAIERRVGRRRRVRAAALGTVLLATSTAGLAATGALDDEPPCAGLRDEAMSAWSEGDREAVRSGLVGSGSEHAIEAWNHAREGLDAYTTAWAAARAEACEATLVHEVAGEQTLVRRMACLDGRAEHVAAVVEALENADSLTAAYASELVDRLPPLEPCADADGLLRGPAPVPEALADEAAGLQRLIARTWIMSTAQRGSRSLEAADEAVARAEALTDVPELRADALYNRGRALQFARRFDEARTDLEHALGLAEGLEHEELTVDVLRELVILAHEDGDASTARAWLAMVRGRLVRRDDVRRDAQRWFLEGLIALQSRRSEEAVHAAERAVAQYDALHPGAPLELLDARLLLGDALQLGKDHEGARRAYEEAVELAEARGYRIQLARVYVKLGRLDLNEGALDAAQRRLEDSLALRDELYGPLAPASVRTRQILANVHRLRGDLPHAMEQAELARRSLDERVSPRHRAEVLVLLASLHRANGQWDEAIARYREAKEAWSAMASPDRIELAMLDSNLGDCLAARGDLEPAFEHYGRALERLGLEAPSDDPRRAYPLYGRGEIQRRRGEHAAAVTSYREALRLRRHTGDDPALDAMLRWSLGRALWPDEPVLPPDPSLRDEAIGLARDARARFADAGQARLVAEADAWLERAPR